MKTLLDILEAIIYIIVSLIIVVIVAIAWYITIILELGKELIIFIKRKLK
jgi:hypothetical protein